MPESFSTHILTRRMTGTAHRIQESGCFSTHILTRRMTAPWPMISSGQHFQLTSSQGGWRRIKLLLQKNVFFSSHPHKEDDSSGSRIESVTYSFQLTSSQGGWQLTLQNFHLIRIFQLTSSQGGWPFSLPFQAFIRSFSTHILTRRMTHGLRGTSTD